MVELSKKLEQSDQYKFIDFQELTIGNSPIRDFKHHFTRERRIIRESDEEINRINMMKN